MNKIIAASFLLWSATAWCDNNEGIMLLPADVPVPDFSQVEQTAPEEEKYPGRTRLKSTVLELETKAKVYVPLEIVSDVEIKALVVDSQELRVPFEIEFNKEPERKNLYAVNFSEEEIDMDRDGTTDTFIKSPKVITGKTLAGNEVLIKGSGISKEGTFKKKVYMTVEVREEI